MLCKQWRAVCFLFSQPCTMCHDCRTPRSPTPSLGIDDVSKEDSRMKDAIWWVSSRAGPQRWAILSLLFPFTQAYRSYLRSIVIPPGRSWIRRATDPLIKTLVWLTLMNVTRHYTTHSDMLSDWACGSFTALVKPPMISSHHNTARDEWLMMNIYPKITSLERRRKGFHVSAFDWKRHFPQPNYKSQLTHSNIQSRTVLITPSV